MGDRSKMSLGYPIIVDYRKLAEKLREELKLI